MQAWLGTDTVRDSTSFTEDHLPKCVRKNCHFRMTKSLLIVVVLTFVARQVARIRKVGGKYRLFFRSPVC